MRQQARLHAASLLSGRPLQIRRFAHIKKVGLKAEGLRRPLRFRPLRLKNWIVHVEEPRDPSQPRYQFFEYLDSLSVGLNIERAKARDIPSRTCEAGDDPGSDGITAPRHDYWNSCGSGLGGLRGGRSPGHDQVDVQANQFTGQIREAILAAIG